MAHVRIQTIPNYGTYLKLTKKANFVLLHLTDILGYLKGRMIPAEQAKNALTQGVTFEGSSMIRGNSIKDSDMMMKPHTSAG